MPIYKAPVRDIMFVLDEVLNLPEVDLPGYSEATPDLLQAILDEAAKFAENELLPINQIGDQQGCTRHADGAVTTPDGFKEAYQKYIEGGWMGIAASKEFGGQGMPRPIGMVMEEITSSANHSWTMYPGLTHGAAAAIKIDGTDAQKQKYLPKMTSGQWTGTMNLTEAHCGTDLGMLRTKAEPQADGTYKVTGTKIFISSGEHDLSENIIHLVLARLPDAPMGTKGISLFIVPKYIIDEKGESGERNGVICGSLEEKMGIHANATCVMNFDGATGYLLGEENKGLNSMFIMMNGARLGTGVQGLSHSEFAYQNAAAYANDRLQGRSLTGPKNADGPADPIIVHPDVRRMLMDCRSFNESARLLTGWASILVDKSLIGESAEIRQGAEDILGLLTPIVKGIFTDMGFENAVKAQQVFGGHGYIKEWGMEQCVRDARIAQIYEGTNGIQALDLVGRKLPANGGRGIQTYFKIVQDLINETKDNDELKAYTDNLQKGLGRLQSASMWLMQNAMANRDNAGSASYAYMHLMGRVVLGHMWLWMGKTCTDTLAAGTSDEDFYKNKLLTGRYFMNFRLPETGTLLKQIEAGSEDMMALAADDF